MRGDILGCRFRFIGLTGFLMQVRLIADKRGAVDIVLLVIKEENAFKNKVHYVKRFSDSKAWQ